MKTVSLTKGLLATVDDGDFELVSKYRWSASVCNGGHVYAVACINGWNQRMHRFILGLGRRKDDKRVIDHIDGDSLNNVRSNLRICTVAQNAKNVRKVSGALSRFKGAQFNQGLWSTSITSDGDKHYIGSFDHEVMAAVTYNKHARRLHGEFARLNELRFERDINALLEQKEQIELEIRRLCDMELEALQ